jgi:Putative peptidoglycan binding domain/LysM domain
MIKHIVQQGECLSRLAYEYGVPLERIWNDAQNKKDLKDLRKNPYVLKPGDVVWIPDKRVKEVSKPTGQRHKFRRKGAREKLVIKFMRGEDLRANEKCTVEIDGKRSETSTSGGGLLELDIAPNAKIVVVTFDKEGDIHEFELGGLDPITEDSGIQARLRNLGLYRGPVDGLQSQEYTDAIKLFQERNKLAQTGTVDQAFKDALEKAHGV